MVVTNGLDYKVENHLIPAFEELDEIEVRDICISTQSSTIYLLFPQIRSIIFSLTLLTPKRSSTAS